MPWTQHIDQEFNCVVVVHEGQWEDVEFLFQYRELVNHPDHREGMNILRDARQTRPSPNLKYDWFVRHREELVGIDQKLGKCRHAAVVRSSYHTGIANQARLMLDDTQVERKPFMDMLEAKRWLRLPTDYHLDLVSNELAILTA